MKKKFGYDYFLKSVLIGNSGVGKSSFLVRFTDDSFKDNLMPSIGVDFKFKQFTINNKIVKL